MKNWKTVLSILSAISLIACDLNTTKGGLTHEINKQNGAKERINFSSNSDTSHEYKYAPFIKALNIEDLRFDYPGDQFRFPRVKGYGVLRVFPDLRIVGFDAGGSHRFEDALVGVGCRIDLESFG